MTYNKYKQNTGKVIVLSINATKASTGAITMYNNTYKVQFPTINNDGTIFKAFNQQGTPAGVLVSPDKSYIEFFPADIQIVLQQVKAPDPDSALVLGTPSTDLLAGKWSAAVDNIGSTVDTTGGIVQNGIVKAKFSKVNDQNAGILLRVTYDTPPPKKPVLKFEFKSASDWFIMPITSGSGAKNDTSEFDAAGSEDWKVMKIRMDSLDIYQFQVLPAKQVVFDVSKLKGFQFVSAAVAGEFELEIKELRLYDTTGTPVKEIVESVSHKDTPQFTVCHNTVAFTTNACDRYTISIFNANGRFVTTIANRIFAQGSYMVPFNASSLSKGIYLVELKSPGYRVAEKLVISK